MEATKMVEERKIKIVRRLKQLSPAIKGVLIKNQRVTMASEIVNEELRVTFAVKRKTECNASYLNDLLKKRLTMPERCLAIDLKDVPEEKRNRISQIVMEMWKLMLEDRVKRHGAEGVTDVDGDMNFFSLAEFMTHVQHRISMHPQRDVSKEMLHRIMMNETAFDEKQVEVATVESETKETAEEKPEVVNEEDQDVEEEVVNDENKDESF